MNNESPSRHRVLIAEDNELAARQLRDYLERELPVEVETAADGLLARDALERRFFSVLLTDLHMPNLDGMQLIREVRQRRIPTTIIVMTGHGSIDTAVEAMRLGAYDFLTKPLNLDRLKLVLQRVLKERELHDELELLRDRYDKRDAEIPIVTQSKPMQSILELVRHIAPTPTSVLIEGETGCGKEIIARAIHQASLLNRPGVMVAVHCAALPESLLESELFGHEVGSFTGAICQRKGRFEQAHRGTLFLDEIAEVPLSMQVKLLRALQEKTFERVGGTETVEVDVRVIAATNRSLSHLVRRGSFREDLYYRVNVVRIEIPPLRERPEDIPLLAEFFCRKYTRPGESEKRVSGPAMDLLLRYVWPGNVRELENVMERACVTSPGEYIEAEHLTRELSQPAVVRSPYRVDIERPLPDLIREITADVERRYIRKALARTHGNVSRCSKLCGLSRRSVTSKIAEYKIRREELKGKSNA